jgi:hypothetical protein
MKSKFVILLIVIFLCNSSYAWENIKTHPAITDNGITTSIADNYLKTQMGLADGVTTQLFWNFPQDIKIRIGKGAANPNQTIRNISEWIRVGSIIEDQDTRFFPPPWRPRHHFYDPIRNSGLDNHTDHPDWDAPGTSSWLPLGQSALNWTILGTALQEPFTNNEKWANARSMFYDSMKNQSKSVRDANLAETLLKLGCVLHMLEDMGVPAHTRNDFLYAHYRSVYKWDWKNPLEKWVEEQVDATANDNIPPDWLTGWTPQAKVFDQVSKYWDSGLYTGQYVGNIPTANWGLSEQTNYQFLSMSTVFGCDGTLYQFPQPAESNTILASELHGGAGGKYYRYFQGYGLQHLARQTYIAYKGNIYGGSAAVLTKKTITPDYDVNVYNDYVRVTIPRTIDYATGLLNYFFRGKLEIEPNCLDCNTITLVIRNDSNNSGVPQTLKGGTFELFWDDHDGNRTEVNDFSIPGWTTSSELAYNEQVTGTFNKPDSNQIEKYTVVYKGQISENPSQPDENDSNALAVATLKMGYPIIAWGRDVEGQVSGVPEGNDFVDVAAGKYHGLAIRSNGSLVAWGYNDYGQCNVPEGNDFIAIAGGSRHSLALRSNGLIVGFGDNTLGQIDVPEGNDYVAIACGDYHNLAINKQGSVVGWGGYNDYGECDAPQPDSGTTFVTISAGSYHSLGLQSDGTVRAWGSNTMGQTRIYSGAGNDHKAVAAGGNYSFLLLTDNSLVYWGGGDWYQPGIPNYHWRMDGNNYIAIAAGGFHIAALTNDGRILSWGYNNYDPPPYPVPSGVTFVKDLVAGWKFTVALKSRQ